MGLCSIPYSIENGHEIYAGKKRSAPIFRIGLLLYWVEKITAKTD